MAIRVVAKYHPTDENIVGNRRLKAPAASPRKTTFTKRPTRTIPKSIASRPCKYLIHYGMEKE
jgi:hypothetical protein